jgi:multimeric flavodoxin WrbA
MKSLLIVYHSQSGSAASLEDVNTVVKRAWDACAADLVSSDALLLVAAENSGFVSGSMKDFLDRTFYPAIEARIVQSYALLISAGNDGRGAVRQMDRILSGIPFSPATEPLILRGEVTPEYLLSARELGQAFSAGLAMGIY